MAKLSKKENLQSKIMFWTCDLPESKTFQVFEGLNGSPNYLFQFTYTDDAEREKEFQERTTNWLRTHSGNWGDG